MMIDAHLTSAEKVILGLRAAIISGSYAAGEQIRQEKIAAEFNVSRMPVREAFRQLEAEGLLVVFPGRGTYVNRLSNEEVIEICDIRILLECDAIRRAVPKLRQTDLLEAEHLLQKMMQAEDPHSFGTLDQAFHETLYAPTNRGRLLELIRTLRNQVTQFLYAASTLDSFRPSAIEDHKNILIACQAGDIESAVDAVKTHLQNAVIQITSASDYANSTDL